MLEDLVRAAVNQALNKAREAVAEETGKMAGEPRAAAGDEARRGWANGRGKVVAASGSTDAQGRVDSQPG